MITELLIADPMIPAESRKEIVERVFGSSFDLKVDQCTGCKRKRLVLAFDNPVACETCICGDCLVSTAVYMYYKAGYRPNE